MTSLWNMPYSGREIYAHIKKTDMDPKKYNVFFNTFAVSGQLYYVLVL